MSKKNIDPSVESRVCFEQLEEWVREQIQFYVQELLEDEVTQLLGRRKNERRREVGGTRWLSQRLRQGAATDAELRNDQAAASPSAGSGKSVLRAGSCRCLPKRTREVRDLIPELYLHGLAEGDFDLALRGLLGEEAPLSPSTVARLKQKWQGEMEAWQSRRLDDLEVVYLWADGVYIKAGLEKEKAVILVVIAALSDGTKVVVSVSSGYRESTQSWSEVLRYLKERGMNPPRLVIADGHLGIWERCATSSQEADEQRCWNHRIVNLLAKIPKGRHKAALLMLRQIPYAETRQEAE